MKTLLPTTTTSIPESKITVIGPKVLANYPGIQGSSTYNLLGYGYDVTGKYADTSAVRHQALNVDAYITNNPDRFIINLASSSYAEAFHTENAENFAQQTSYWLTATKGLKLFKGSITIPFPDSDALSRKYVYGSFSQVIQRKRLRYMENYDLLKNYLTLDFSRDLSTLSAASLIKKYGTHVLSDVILGAKFNVYYQAVSTASDRKISETAGFTYALQKVFGLFSGSIDAVTDERLKTISSPKVVYEALGADVTKIKVNKLDDNTNVSIVDWHSSTTIDNSVFIDIGENGLVPLYELISDPTKKLEVKNYITSYLIAQQVKVH
ncbi:hypothetical protein HH214_04570 [Mucilaginibacter robiniae]|uniref:MACPF domain-containing protein n=1 Tax=Mucilaginibacter robiniae TaxID=2728022 RepID=A0A7L5DVU4_9SPHI|nr:MAC/perforin domain-containing protein [Mucilaginibacter robiniae]QJD95202.1 hypothetical protein HH214_04570 [Mucilaginibacter robiniae]